ncbi:MAG TPA: FAD-binding and (Fe-S)-binding domain-containing protein, partial [Desulfobacterales bacterium]|nr:FAD-binding and (Fe-S)-binding domain-containing protein [Desulfobacterales bacterium]
SDSVLVVAGEGWSRYEILDGGLRIRLQAGVVGGHANRCLAPYGRKIGPDPASINAAMIGGIAANNASGMCCGTAQNSYRTVAGLRLVLQDGTVLDTADPASRDQFRHTHKHVLDALDALGRQVRSDAALAARIRRKYAIKNTTGYSLNALVDYEDPFDILVHLMIGSEGTLGFMSEVTYHTVEEHPCKASALMIFPHIEHAATAAAILKGQPVAAVELMDRASMRSVENKSGMPDYLKSLRPDTAALLVETRAHTAGELSGQIRRVTDSLARLPFERPAIFTDQAAETTRLWNIRKGLFPAVGAVRDTGTTVIIEDVAFPIDRLARATLELQEVFRRYRYDEAIIFGHALEGNLHFCFTQDFSRETEVERYRRFMDDVCEMVVTTYDGSLKAEHGTGRNMAPFVALEWGADGLAVMQRIKEILDPKNLLNPGVILNPDPRAHVKHLKEMPAADPIVDRCIECGFCEVNCPSRRLTLTPRQRIAVRREISRLKTSCENPARLAALEEGYRYAGEETCAADGLCAVACPVDVNTGDYTKALRGRTASPAAQRAADIAARRFGPVAAAARAGLKVADAAHRALGSAILGALAGTARHLSRGRIPHWTPWMPRGVDGPRPRSHRAGGELQAVYFPSCINRVMGPALGDLDREPLHRVTVRLLEKAGYGVRFPEGMEALCCGTPFESKGFTAQADAKAAELEAALLEATDGGRLPVLVDTSPCLYRMKKTMDRRLTLLDPVEFTLTHLLDRLAVTPVDETIAYHHTCSSVKMGLEARALTLARACARRVLVPERVGCCGFAGDRGFNYPELNASALQHLRTSVAGKCSAGYSTSRTCEIGLSAHSGIHYKSILYLVDRCSAPRCI